MRAITVFIFWHCIAELPRGSGDHGGSAQKGSGWSACLPKNSSLQEDSLQEPCTYFAWFLRSSQLKTVPYFEIPMSISRLRLLMQFRMGSHALPAEQGRLATPAIPRHLCRCSLCVRPGRWEMRGILFLNALILPTFAATFVRCTKRLMVPCSVLYGTRTRRLFATAWQPFSTWLMTPTKTCPHKPMMAEWTSEILSISL